MQIKITRVDNGYIVENIGEDSEVEVVADSEPYTSTGDSMGAMQELLRTVMDKLGHYGSKHEKYRLRVIIEDQQAERDDIFQFPDDEKTWDWIREYTK